MSSKSLPAIRVLPLFLVFSLASGLSSLAGQQRSDLNGMCVASVDGINGMTSAIFSTPARSRGDAERAWTAYAVQQNAGKPIKGARCIWSTTLIDPAKVKITSQNGGKVTQTSWKYDAPLLPAQPAQALRSPGSVSAPARTAGATTPQATASSSSLVAATSAANTNGVSTTTATSAPATGTASMSQTVQQGMQDAKTSASTAVTGTVNTVTTTTVQAVAGGIQSMQASLINRLSRKKPAPVAPQATTAAVVPAVSQGGPEVGSLGSPATAVSPNTGVAAAVASEKPIEGVTRTSPAGLSFTFCHLVASGKEYISDIFPTTGADQNALGAAFWQAMGTQYHLGSIPYRNNVSCVHSATEPEASAALQALKSTGAQRGISAGQELDTGWTHTGN